MDKSNKKVISTISEVSTSVASEKLVFWNTKRPFTKESLCRTYLKEKLSLVALKVALKATFIKASNRVMGNFNGKTKIDIQVITKTDEDRVMENTPILRIRQFAEGCGMKGF